MVKGQEPTMGEERWRELDLFSLAMRRRKGRSDVFC